MTVITSRAAALSDIPGVSVRGVFEAARPTLIRDLANEVGEGSPDWVVLQYDPYAWQIRYGFNPFVPLLFAELRRRCPHVRVAMIVHEIFADPKTARAALLAGWVGAQLWSMGRLADAVFFAVEPWARRFQRWFPKTPVFHLPSGSNVEVQPNRREAVRRERGISERTVVLGLFGRLGATRPLDLVRKSAERLRAEGLEPLIYYLGLQAESVRSSSMLAELPLLAEGPLQTDEISTRMSAIDIFLVPIEEGVSSRRTSLMAGLAHGLATVATSGSITDDIFLRENGRALMLADINDPSLFANHVLTLALDVQRRSTIAAAGRAFFEREFAWERLGERLLRSLRDVAR